MRLLLSIKHLLTNSLVVVFSLSPLSALSYCNDLVGEGTTYEKCYKPKLDASNAKLLEKVIETNKILQDHYRTTGTVAADWFIKSQTAWENYRDLSCEVHSIAKIGPQSSRMNETTNCEISLNKVRIKEIQKLRETISPYQPAKLP